MRDGEGPSYEATQSLSPTIVRAARGTNWQLGTSRPARVRSSRRVLTTPSAEARCPRISCTTSCQIRKVSRLGRGDVLEDLGLWGLKLWDPEVIRPNQRSIAHLNLTGQRRCRREALV
jgi:hypothetical protein